MKQEATTNEYEMYADLYEKIEDARINFVRQNRLLRREIDLLKARDIETRSKVKDCENTLSSFDEEKSKQAVDDFKKEISELHALVKRMITKLCTITEVNYVSNKSYHSNHYEIMKRLIFSLDRDDAWWEGVERKTIGEIINLLMDES